MAREHGVMRIIGNGTALTTPVDEGDLAAAIVARIGQESIVYTVGGPEDLTYNDVAVLVGQALDRTIKVKHYPAALTDAAAKVISPFATDRAALLQLFVFLMTAGSVSEHVGEQRLGNWLREHRDETFEV